MTHLPPEIWMQIAEFTGGFQGEATIDGLHLTQVSRELRSYVLPIVYRRVNLIYNDNTPAVLFSRTCVERPEIALLVKEFEFIGDDIDVHPPEEPPIYDAGWAQTVIRDHSSTDEAQQWENDLAHGSSDAIMPLLFIQLVSLETLILSSLPRKPIHIPRLLQTQSCLQKVRMIELSSTLLKRYLCLLYLPSLSQMRFAFDGEKITCVGDIWLGEEGMSHSPEEEVHHRRRSSIEEMTFEDSVGGPAVQFCIRACKNLKIFEYRQENLQGDLVFGVEPICKALMTQRHSLQRLSVNDRGRFNLINPDMADDGWAGSLAGFSQLHSLQINTSNLLHLSEDQSMLLTPLQDTLPRNLEYLSLVMCPMNLARLLIEGLENVLSRQGELFPYLKEVAVHFARNALDLPKEKPDSIESRSLHRSIHEALLKLEMGFHHRAKIALRISLHDEDLVPPSAFYYLDDNPDLAILYEKSPWPSYMFDRGEDSYSEDGSYPEDDSDAEMEL